jgi:Uma2 family endonuclease
MATELAVDLSSDEQRLVLCDVSWETYEALGRAFDERQIRLTYDEGSLEIMTTSFGHENIGWFLGRLIGILTLELNLPLVGGGSTTLKRKLKQKGLEPDECFWITNAAKMGGKKQWRFRRDPSPDLAIEVEISRSALDRMGIYAALRVGEVWRCTRKALHVHILGADGRYKVKSRSAIFPQLPMQELLGFLRRLAHADDENTVIREFTVWVRTHVVPQTEAPKDPRPARKNGSR